MIQGENTTVVQYELTKNNHPESPKSLRLEVRPLIAFRDYHSTTHENGTLNAAVEQHVGIVSIIPYQGLPTLHLAHNARELAKTGYWYRNFQYDAERERGLDFQEDLFNPLVLKFDLRMRRHAAIVASTEPRDASLARPIGRRRLAVDKMSPRTRLSTMRLRRRSLPLPISIWSLGKNKDGCRWLLLVQRLGPRHNDRSSGPHASDGQT